MRKFWVLLNKELRELITPQIFVPFVVVIVMFVALGQTISHVGAEKTVSSPIVVVDLDHSADSKLIVSTLASSGFEPRVVASMPGREAIRQQLEGAGANILVKIPKGFSAGLQAGRPQQIVTTSRITSFSFIGNRDLTLFPAALAAVNSKLAAEIAQRAAPGTNPALLQTPVAERESVIVGNQQAETPSGAVMAFVSQQTTLIPVVLFIVIIFAAQMIATTIATEKENKTLETLLSYPVSRASIVTSKMVAAGLIALVSAGAYMIGMQQYMKGIEAGIGAAGASPGAAVASEAVMKQLGLTFGASDYLLLGLTLFAGILVALSMAIILGAFAESVKSVQSLLTPLMVLLLAPYFLTMFLDLSTLPDAVRIAVMAIPFTYPFLTGPSLFLGNYGVVWFGIAYQLLWFAVMVTIAARVFSSDRVLTMKLSFKKAKKTEA